MRLLANWSPAHSSHIRPTDPMRQTMASLQMLCHSGLHAFRVLRVIYNELVTEFGSESVTPNVKPQLKAITISGYQTIASQTRSRILHSFHFSLLCVYICYSVSQMFCSQVIAVCLTSRLADSADHQWHCWGPLLGTHRDRRWAIGANEPVIRQMRPNVKHNNHFEPLITDLWKSGAKKSIKKSTTNVNIYSTLLSGTEYQIRNCDNYLNQMFS